MRAAGGYPSSMVTNPNHAADHTTAKPPRRRRWIPLSLRMFVLMLVIMGVGNVVWIGVPAYRQYAAIQEIESLGGTVVCCHTGPLRLRKILGNDGMKAFDRVYSLDLDKKRATDGTLRRIGRLTTGPSSLHLGKTQITDAGLASLTRLTALRTLALDRTQVTDAGLAHLKGMKNLHTIDLFETRVTDAGVADLELALPECKIIRIGVGRTD